MDTVKKRKLRVRKLIAISVLFLSLLLWNIPSLPTLAITQPTKTPNFLKASRSKFANEPSKVLCNDKFRKDSSCKPTPQATASKPANEPCNDEFRKDSSCKPNPQSTSETRCVCPTTIPKSNLIFDDEFSGKSLDIKKWNIEDNSADGYHNCCLGYGLQYYTPEALSSWQGSLRITTQAQDVYDHHYTSGAITTENKFSFTYGRVEIRAKLPQTKRLLACFVVTTYT